MKGLSKKIFQLSTISALIALSSPLYAAGYRLEFQSPSVLSDGGDAAVIDDASTNWYNSAGLPYLPQQLAAGLTDVYQNNHFTGSSTAPSTVGVPFYNFDSGSSSANSKPNAILPNLHYSLPFHERFAFGLSIVPAWGLKENYGEASSVRYNSTSVATKTIDIAPSLAMRLNDQWSIGIGPDFHYLYLTTEAHVRTQPVTNFDSISRYAADNWNTGWHAGILYRMNSATRFGLNYRSKIVSDLSGNSTFAFNGISQLRTNSFKTTIPLPSSTTLSVYHDFTEKWAMMGTIAYDHWSSLGHYYGQNIIQPGLTPGSSTLVNATSIQNMHNTFDYSVGTHYKLNQQWLLRGSLKYLPTPTSDSYRQLLFPDSPKLGINLGARYTINTKLAVDMLYAHVFTQTVHINDVNPITRAQTSGHLSNEVNVVGAQVVWNI